jgi:hypothetical protein
MDATASSFSTRSNAKRAAEQMTAKGTAPAGDYDIKPSNGRFEVVWKIALTTAEFGETAEARANQAGKAEAQDWPDTAATTDEVETEVATATASADEPAASGEPAPAELALSEPAPVTARPKPENKWPNGTRVMVRKRKSWREATIVSRLEPNYWRAEYPGGGSGMFEQSDIRAYDAERDAKLGKQLRRARATAPREASRSRYAVDPEAIAAGRLPEKAPVVTSKANPHYQKHFDRLFGLARAGNWDAVRNYEVKGSNSYSKMIARYRRDLLALQAGGCPMSEREILAHYHDRCASRPTGASNFGSNC